MRLKNKIVFLFLFLSIVAVGQDVQLSQYYNTPLYLNPAFTGTGNNTRAIFNYRNQWTALPSPYVTYTASFDHYIAPYSSGVGLLVQSDRQGDGRIQSTSASLLYSYHVWLSEKLTFIPALQVGFTNRTNNYAGYIFGDQIDVNGPMGVPTSDNIVNGPNLNFLDIGTGGLLYSDRFWFGYAGSHLNRPNQAAFGSNKLPLKSSFHGGYKFLLEKPKKHSMKWRGYEKEKSIIPTFLYKKQGDFDQLDLGVYAIYEPLMFGLWYRGLPVKKYKVGVNNREALIFLVGIHYQGLTLGYSYDLTVSSFRPGTGGSHEITVAYHWEIPYPKNSIKKHPRKVSCPSFY